MPRNLGSPPQIAAFSSATTDRPAALIRTARPLYTPDPIGVDLDQSLYALDSTTIDLCLTLFPSANFRKRKSAVKMHALLDLHGNIPTFISSTDGKVHDVNILDDIFREVGALATSISSTSTGSIATHIRWTRLRAGGHRPQTSATGGGPLPNSTDFECDPFRENAHFTGTSSIGLRERSKRLWQPIDSVLLIACPHEVI